MTVEFWSTPVWWCPKCGIVWADPDRGPRAPTCRHNVPDPDIAAARMEPLPAWHPMAKEAA